MAYAPGDRCPLCGGTLRVGKDREGLVCTGCGLGISGVQVQPPPAVQKAAKAAPKPPKKSKAQKRGPVCPSCRQPFVPELTSVDKLTAVSCANCHMVVGVLPDAARKRSRGKTTGKKK